MSGIDYQAAGFWLTAAQWVAMGVLTVWTYLRTADRKQEEAIKELADQQEQAIKELAGQFAEFRSQAGAQSERMAHLEERVQHMPTSDDLTEVAGDVKQVRAEVEGMQELLRRVEHQTNLIHQHLLLK